ncbi:diacylglycerol kinase family protein [Streptomyces sp. NPDC048156]|uniref:diacylglycerol kinase family protein n=1 Tax=Streptomyces sp. NPDC048156 TaxID=3365502 RepID=UPI003722D935
MLRRVAGHNAVWLGAAAVLGMSGGRSARRAALRGIGSVAIAAAIDRTLAKPPTRSARPVLDALPRIVPRPSSASLPSSPIASAAAFASGVALESPCYGLAVLPFAAGQAYVRGREGLGHRGRTAAGVIVGVGAALLTCRWWPVKPEAAAAAAPPRRPAPALVAGKGLHLVVNPSSGISWTQDTAETLRNLLPEAAITVFEPGDELVALLDEAALRAGAGGGALGVCGSDGTVNAGSTTAARHHVPLAAFPGGTFNHFAVDLGNQTLEDVARAPRVGDAVMPTWAGHRHPSVAAAPTVVRRTVHPTARPAFRRAAVNSSSSSTRSASGCIRNSSTPGSVWRSASVGGPRWPWAWPRS